MVAWVLAERTRYRSEIPSNRRPYTLFQPDSPTQAYAQTGRGTSMKVPGLPAKQGLYDPQFEKDSCGIGFVVMYGISAHNDLVPPEKAWIGESMSRASDIGVFASRAECVEAIKNVPARCRVVLK